MDKLVFTEKELQPTNELLRDVMGESYNFYTELVDEIKKILPELSTDWKFYGKKNGWLLKHFYKKKNLFFLIVYKGFFKLSYTFGDKAITEIIESDDISTDTKELIKSSKKYAEGTPVILSVNSETEVNEALNLLKFKV